MKTLFLCLILFLSCLPSKAYAIEDPRSVANNKVGIHILFDFELKDAAKLVNSNGGKWGYVTIPIQIGDRDLEKWQKFMDLAKQNHVIPIIRLATQADFFNTSVWKKPADTDIVDFANFLHSLDWPTKNKYVVIFNEVNRGDEWGGSVNPEEYAQILSFASSFFKSLDTDFFILPAGLDNAAPNSGDKYMNEYVFLRKMNDLVPGIFDTIDGLTSHSYPNPGFSQPPTALGQTGIASFRFEKTLIDSMSNKNFPVFITETGWSANSISDEQRSNYLKEAYATVWNDKDVVAVTPFLLKAGDGPFTQFSFLKEDGSITMQYSKLENAAKTAGNPQPAVIKNAPDIEKREPIPNRIFELPKKEVKKISRGEVFTESFKWIMRLN